MRDHKGQLLHHSMTLELKLDQTGYKHVVIQFGQDAIVQLLDFYLNEAGHDATVPALL